MIKIYNEDCLKTMQDTLAEKSIDVVITSPPYNNSRTSHTEYSMKTRNCRYAEYDDNMSNEEYCEWICKVFNGYNRILKKDGVVLFNISYGSENANIFFDCSYHIIHDTPFMVADIITWKKKCAFPNNVSANKLTRICEYVLVCCRKDEYATYHANKEVTSINERTQQPFYSPLYNFIEASNNDASNELNGATFSTDFVLRLMEMYVDETVANSSINIYDSFMGTGTTAMACKIKGYNCYGSEISAKQCEFAEKRLAFNNNVFATVEKKATRFGWDI